MTQQQPWKRTNKFREARLHLHPIMIVITKVCYLKVLAGDRHDSLWTWSIWDPAAGFCVNDFDSDTQVGAPPDGGIVV